MEELLDCKSFKDNVHGYIEIPKLIVENIIDTRNFQRLRYIEQTGMRILYPSARHDRFVHSIGVFYLGSIVSKYFVENIRKNAYSELKFLFEKNEFEIKKNVLLFKLACLLHDVAHSPFSHSYENYYEKIGKISDISIFELFEECYITDQNSDDFKPYMTFTPHEMASAIVVKKVYKNPIMKILSGYFSDKNMKCQFSLLTIDEDLEFIARMIVGCKYCNDDPKYQIRNCFIDLLNSKQFDVDKLDYVIRDSIMSGIDNISIDVERLCRSVTMFKINIFECDKGVPLKLETPTLVLSSKLQGNVDIAGIISGDIKAKNITIKANGKLRLHGRAVCNSEIKVRANDKSWLKIDGKSVNIVNKYYTASIANESDYDISGDDCTIEQLVIKDSKFSVSNAKMNISAVSDSSTINLESCYFSGLIDGDISFEAICSKNSKRAKKARYQIAFKKGSLSIFQNLNLARNYEYLWIYSHHKVVYYANYLLQATLSAATKCCNQVVAPWNIISVTALLDGYPKCEVDGQYFDMICDGDITCFFKNTYLKLMKKGKKTKDEELFCSLYNELYSRVYRKTLYKSYSEFDILFKDWTDEQCQALKTELKRGVSKNQEPYYYGEFGDDGELSDLGFNKLLWVDTSPNLKSIDLKEVFFVFSPDQIVNLSKLPISSKWEESPKMDKYFYLYYYPNDNYKKNISEEKLLKYFAKKYPNIFSH